MMNSKAAIESFISSTTMELDGACWGLHGVFRFLGLLGESAAIRIESGLAVDAEKRDEIVFAMRINDDLVCVMKPELAVATADFIEANAEHIPGPPSNHDQIVSMAAAIRKAVRDLIAQTKALEETGNFIQ